MEEARVPLAAGLVGALLQRGTPYVLLDLASDQSTPPLDPWFAAGALASILTVRLQVQGETVGALLLGHGRPGGYSVMDIALAEQVAVQLGMVLTGWVQREAQTATRAALHQSEALNRQLLESSEDAISILDLAGTPAVHKPQWPARLGVGRCPPWARDLLDRLLGSGGSPGGRGRGDGGTRRPRAL